MTELSSVLLKEVCALVAQLIKNLPAMQETLVDSWVGKIPWRRAWQPRESHGQRSLEGSMESMGSQSDMNE